MERDAVLSRHGTILMLVVFLVIVLSVLLLLFLIVLLFLIHLVVASLFLKILSFCFRPYTFCGAKSFLW